MIIKEYMTVFIKVRIIQMGEIIDELLLETISKDEFLHRMALSYYRIQNEASGKQILDYGCGYGWGSYLLSLKAKSVEGFDIDYERIIFAKEMFRRENLNYSNQRCFENKKYDIICMFQVLQHVTSPHEVINLLSKSMKESGIIKVSIKRSCKEVQKVLKDIVIKGHLFLLYKKMYPLSLEDDVIEYGLGRRKMSRCENEKN